jgi:hypothetical protein
MVAPIDYTLQGVQSPFQALAQGMQFGAGLAQAQAQRQQFEAQAALAQQKAEAERIALERQRQIGTAMSALIANPNRTAQDYEAVAVMLPEKEAASLRANFEMRTKEQQGKDLGFAMQTMSAFDAGSPDVGLRLLREKAQAERNSGREDQAKAYETWASIAEQNPQAASATIGTLVSRLPGGKEAIEGYAKVRDQQRAQIKFPIEMAKSEAEAKSAAVAAKFAESKAVRELEEKGWNIAKLQNDIEVSKQNVRIATLQAQLAKESNDLKRREVEAKITEAQDKRDTTIREKAADLEAARFNVDNMLNTATRIINTPKSVIGAAAGPISARIITTSQATADLEELVTTLGSQSFLAQIPNIKGMGQLSNAEGEKLQAALQNFSLRQSPERLIENVKEAQRLLTKARKNMTARAGLPESAPDVPAAGGPPIPTTMQPPPAPGFTAATPAFAPAPQMPAGFRLLPPSGR